MVKLLPPVVMARLAVLVQMLALVLVPALVLGLVLELRRTNLGSRSSLGWC